MSARPFAGTAGAAGGTRVPGPTPSPGTGETLLDAVRLLHPDSTVEVGRHGSPTYLPMPPRGPAAALLPAGHPAASARAALGWGARPGTGAPRLRQVALAAALRAGAGALLPRRVTVTPEGEATPGLAERLSGVLGTAVVLSLRTGSARPNGKPVAQALTPDGHLVAYAKIARSPLARRLLGAESAALERLSAEPVPGLRAPRLLWQGAWRDTDVLVLEPLPLPTGAGAAVRALARSARATVSGLGHRPRHLAPLPTATTSAMVALAARDAEVRPLAGTPFLSGLAGAGGAAAAVAAACARAAGSADLRFGSWHGDWTPWNCAVPAAGTPVLVWDWERAASGVPAGFDAVHHRFNDCRVGAGLPVGPAAEATLALAPRDLAPFGLTPAAARLVAVLQLAHLAVRYSADGREPAGERVAGLARELLAVLPGLAAGLAPLGPDDAAGVTAAGA